MIALSPTDARAGAKPHLEKVDPLNPMAGGVVDIVGTNFSDELKEVAATVGGEAAIVLETAPERLKILVPPGLKKGVYPLEVTVAGERSNAVELTIRPDSDRDQKAKEDAERYEGGGTSRLSPQNVLTLESPEPLFDRGSFLIKVGGQAQLPDGCTISLQLKLGNDLIANVEAAVQAQRFGTAFGPYTRELFAGNYWVDALFNINDQPKRIRDAFKGQFKDPLERAAHERASARQACRVGNAAQEQQQNAELRGHIAGSIARVRELVKDLEKAYAASGRSAFRKDGKVDEAAWEAWLGKRSLRGVGDAEKPARLAELRANKSFLTDDGAFADTKWREWLDHKFRADVFALAKAHMAYRDRFLVIKYPDAMIKLESLFGMLGQLSQVRSRDLYERNGIPVASQDEAQAGLDVLKLGGGRVSPGLIDQAARKIAREVGLTAADEAQAAAQKPKEE